MNEQDMIIKLFPPQEVTVYKLYESVVAMSNHEISIALNFTHLVTNLVNEFSDKNNLSIDDLFNQMDVALFHELCRRDVVACNCPSQN